MPVSGPASLSSEGCITAPCSTSPRSVSTKLRRSCSTSPRSVSTKLRRSCSSSPRSVSATPYSTTRVGA
eukprot:3295830-Rhodomonas_salina.3